jgi:hypothetical protein
MDPTQTTLKEVTEALADHIEMCIVDLSVALDHIKENPDSALGPSIFDMTDRLNSISSDVERAANCCSFAVPLIVNGKPDSSNIDYSIAFNALL